MLGFGVRLLVYFFIFVDSGGHGCVAEQVRDKSSRLLMLESGETSVKTNRPCRQKGPVETPSNSEIPS